MTTFTYKHPKQIFGYTPECVVRSDGVQIPKDPNNTHYQEYLEWVAEGNTITDNGGGE